MYYKFCKIVSISIILLAIIWFAGLLKFISDTKEIAKNDHIDKNIDAIIVLTGGSGRIRTGLEILSQGRVQKMFISGVGKDADKNSLLVTSGKLPDNIDSLIDKIELGRDATNTKGNAIESKKWIKSNNIKNIILVTSDFHLLRSLYQFKKTIPDVNIIPSAVATPQINKQYWWKDFYSFYLLGKEYNKYIATKLI